MATVKPPAHRVVLRLHRQCPLPTHFCPSARRDLDGGSQGKTAIQRHVPSRGDSFEASAISGTCEPQSILDWHARDQSHPIGDLLSYCLGNFLNRTIARRERAQPRVLLNCEACIAYAYRAPDQFGPVKEVELHACGIGFRSDARNMIVTGTPFGSMRSPRWAALMAKADIIALRTHDVTKTPIASIFGF